jgi:hypothetical protein
MLAGPVFFNVTFQSSGGFTFIARGNALRGVAMSLAKAAHVLFCSQRIKIIAFPRFSNVEKVLA